MSGFINLDTWKRREHFHLFLQFANPFWSVCTDVDVTRLWKLCQEKSETSFSLATIYIALAAANDTEAFRLRIREDKVWIHDRIDISTTVMRQDDTFGFALFRMTDTFAEFEKHARPEGASAKASKTLGDAMSGRDDLIYHSTLPWIRFTGLSNPTAGRQDSIPRVVFGRCSQQDGRWRMPVCVEVHHSLVDGLDVGRFFLKFERDLQRNSGDAP